MPKIPAFHHKPMEVQKLHDMLHEVILSVVPWPLDEPEADIRPILTAYEDVLCWLLGHEHNKNFPRNMTLLFDKLEAMGYTYHRDHELN